MRAPQPKSPPPPALRLYDPDPADLAGIGPEPDAALTARWPHLRLLSPAALAWARAVVDTLEDGAGPPGLLGDALDALDGHSAEEARRATAT